MRHTKNSQVSIYLSTEDHHQLLTVANEMRRPVSATIRTLLEDVISGRLKPNLTCNKPQKEGKRSNSFLTEDTKAQVESLRVAHNLSMSELVVRTVAAYLNQSAGE